MNKYYTGIGTREENLPKGVQSLMVAMGKGLAKRGYILRSGAASGADTAFEVGCESGGGEAEIFLPWRGFRNRRNQSKDAKIRFYVPNDGRMEHAGNYWVESGIIPHYFKMSPSSRWFHGRNYYQVTGKDGTHSDFVLYYAPHDLNDEPMGGTRSAVMRARDLGIPTYNLGNEVEILAFESTWR